MKRFTTLLLVLVSAAPVAAAEIGFVEDFALAPDRASALEQLIPGTRDFYYYSCLHYQNTGDLDKVDDLLTQWVKRHKRTGRVPEIQNRQALLRYSDSPKRTLDFLRGRLNLRFNHPRDVAGEGRKLPTRLDSALISRETLTRLALERHRGTMAGFEDRALEWASQFSLSADRRRHLLARLQRPDVPGLARLVIDDLNTRHSRGFGSHPIHERLLLDQLKECDRLKPNLRNETRFVSAYLPKLWPHADVDWRHDVQARQTYLDRLWGFVSTLSEAHNSLRAHVLYHRLAHDRALGVHDKERFVRYLGTPRRVSYIEPRFLKRAGNRKHAANLGEDFSGATQLPPVGDDEPLVRSYFEHFFQTEDAWQPYADYVLDGYLKRRFAETKILAGIGDMESWYSLLSPEEYQALKERVDIDFAATNNVVFSPDEQVALDVRVKNVRNLIVKVFEVNAPNYYRVFQREVDTAIDLDGLVANQEETYTYTEPALRRVKRHFEFPWLKPRGVYVIDFIGNGKSSRALVRRGQLRFLMRDSVAGHVFTVLDESNQRLPDAAMWLGGQRYTAANDGTISVPFSNQPGRRPVVLENDGFASLHFVHHDVERYALTAGIHCEREALVARKKATVVVRPSLTLNGTLVTLSVLENVTLSVTTTDLDGVQTTKEVKDFEISEGKESTYDFQVPANLQRLSVLLRATVKSLSQDKDVELNAARVFALNGIDSTEKIEDLHLAFALGRYVLDILGKSGEVLEKRPVQITVKHRDFRDVVQLEFQSDTAGRLDLGRLFDIEWVAVRGANGVGHQWQLPEDRATLPATLHARAGEALLVPFMSGGDRPSREDVSLFELRGETFLNDRFGVLAFDDGFLRIDGLDPGDYELTVKRTGDRIPVRVTAGEAWEKHILSSYRQLEINYTKPVQISRIATSGDDIAVHLRNANKFTRVHVAATRFLPEFNPYSDLDSVPSVTPVRTLIPPPETLYVVGRDIGEEYRYVLERKYAKKFPGVMLERPNLLLNPWAIRDTSTGQRLARAGELFKRKSSDSEVESSEELVEYFGQQAAQHTGFSSVDFLSSGAAFLTNLRPAKDGVVRLKRKDLGAGQHLHVVVVDPEQTVYRHVAIGHTSSEFADRRLHNGLDPDDHFTEKKSVSVIKKDAQFALDDITTSEFEVYDNLERIYALFVTLTGDANLRAFRFAIDWPTLTPDEKRERYSEFACHELNFFLFKKDPEFFAAVVKPYLENKYHRTFLDDWLLGKELTPYLEPWAYARLNVVERILLAQRIEGEGPFTQRHVEDAFDLVPVDQDRLNHLFRTALRGRALEVGDAFDVAGKLDELRAKEESDGKLKDLRHRRSARASKVQSEALGRGQAAGEKGIAAAVPEEPQAPVAAAEFEGEDDNLGSLADAEEDAEMYFDDDEGKRAGVRQLYRKLDRTREWVENNYYHVPIEQQNAALITVNAFWRDFARFDGDGPFFSSNLAETARNFSEMMFALSVLDLPFQADEHKSEISDRRFVLDAASPLIVFHKEIRPAEASDSDLPILVSQNFYRHGERYRQVGNERVDNYVADEFLVHSVFGCHVVVTNPTSSRQKLNVLLQIPEGAIAVLKGQTTRSLDLVLEPYRTWTHDHFFYFPSVGTYEHFPVHVAKAERLVARADASMFTVVAEPSSLDHESWDYVSQLGTPAEVVRFLTERNLSRVNLERIAWRMRDRTLFESVVGLLSKRHVYQHTLWSYGVFHDVPAATQEYLRHADGFVQQCGDALVSPLLVIDPVERRSYQHMEYHPLVNARSHRLGRRREILNDRFYGQYLRLVKILAYRRDLDADDLMSVTYYLLLQDRVEEAIAYFDRVRPQELASKVQYDYFSAYLALSRENLRQAREVASAYEDYPIARWQQFFTAVTSQVDEIEGADPAVVDPKDRTQKQTRLAATEPSFDFVVEGKRVLMTHANVEKCRVNYYRMDLELLFSRNPFVQQYAGQFAFIRPNMSDELPLDPTSAEHSFDIPERFANTNVLVEIVSGGVKKSRPYFANALTVDVAENYAHLRVAARDANRGLSKVYVKVYARLQNGAVRFYKDGYTDLRGRFDYGSLSTNEIERVQSFSILVMSDKHGALVREAQPPRM